MDIFEMGTPWGGDIIRLHERIAALETALAKQRQVNNALEAMLPYLGREVHYRDQWADLQDALREAR